jgi:hypothetical protein
MVAVAIKPTKEADSMKRLTGLPRVKNSVALLGASVIGVSLMLPVAGFAAVCSPAGHQAKLSSGTVNGQRYAQDDRDNNYNNNTENENRDWTLTPREQEKARREELRHEHHDENNNESFRDSQRNDESWRNNENDDHAEMRHHMHERHEMNDNNAPDQGEND